MNSIVAGLRLPSLQMEMALEARTEITSLKILTWSSGFCVIIVLKVSGDHQLSHQTLAVAK